MIKLNIAVPAFLVMTAVTPASLFAFVNIIFLVAGKAVSFHFVFVKITFMAMVAAGFIVFTQ